MAVKRNKPDSQNQKEEPEKKLESAEVKENPKEPAEIQDGEGENKQMPEKPKVLVATRPILYLAKWYAAGEQLPLNNQEMAAAWIEAGSAAWQESGTKQFP